MEILRGRCFTLINPSPRLIRDQGRLAVTASIQTWASELSLPEAWRWRTDQRQRQAGARLLRRGDPTGAYLPFAHNVLGLRKAMVSDVTAFPPSAPQGSGRAGRNLSSDVISGKRHFGAKIERSPWAWGFDRSFALLPAAASHFGPGAGGGFSPVATVYSEDDRFVDVGDDFYSSDSTDALLGYLCDRPHDDDRPFFAHLACQAPHWPLQAPGESIAKYHGRYDDGPARRGCRRSSGWA